MVRKAGEAEGEGEQGSRGRSILVELLNYGQSSGFDMIAQLLKQQKVGIAHPTFIVYA